MFDLAKLREKRADGEKGFTLIELLVVVVIIGILIAIAIPVYMNYKKGASDKSAESDLRNAINTLEQCNTDNSKYPASLTQGTLPATINDWVPLAADCPSQVVKGSDNTKFIYFPSAAPATKYIIGAYNTAGNGTTTKFWCYASNAGGAVKERTTALSAYADIC